jgi:hypothetical protein
MPGRLSPRATLLLVVLAFDLALAVSLIAARGEPTPEPAAGQTASAPAGRATPAVSSVRLKGAGTVPALREPRHPVRARKREHKRTQVRKQFVRPVATPARVVRRTPVAPAAKVRSEPAATAAPRYVPPAPQPAAPRAAPVVARPAPVVAKPRPAPAAPPPSGTFDTTG